MSRLKNLRLVALLVTIAMPHAYGNQMRSAQAQDAAAQRTPARDARNAALEPVEDVPGLPRVLLIGDSISIGYTLPVREILKGKVNVHRPRTNCGPTTNGLAHLDEWLGNKPWDVIHFNWGLHDLKYVDATGKLVPPTTPDSHPQVSLEQYEKNLRELVGRLKKTDAKLVWCSTTPVPDGANGRIADDSLKYNAVAAKIMQAEGVAINDLHAFAQSKLKDIQIPANVHFTPAGSKVLARQVALEILKAIAAK